VKQKLISMGKEEEEATIEDWLEKKY